MNQEVCPMQIYTVPGGAGTGITVFHFQVRFRIGRTLSTFSVCVYRVQYNCTILHCSGHQRADFVHVRLQAYNVSKEAGYLQMGYANSGPPVLTLNLASTSMELA